MHVAVSSPPSSNIKIIAFFTASFALSPMPCWTFCDSPPPPFISHFLSSNFHSRSPFSYVYHSDLTSLNLFLNLFLTLHLLFLFFMPVSNSYYNSLPMSFATTHSLISIYLSDSYSQHYSHFLYFCTTLQYSNVSDFLIEKAPFEMPHCYLPMSFLNCIYFSISLCQAFIFYPPSDACR